MASKENNQKQEEEKQKDSQQQNKEQQEEKLKNITVLQEIKNQLRILARGIQQNEVRTIQRITKQIRRFKKHLKPHHVARLWEAFFPQNLNDYNFNGMVGFDADFSELLDIPKKNITSLQKYPEIEIYIRTFLLVLLFNQRDLTQDQNQKAQILNKIRQLSHELLTHLDHANKRSLDYLQSIIYFYLFRTYELQNQLKDIREQLFIWYRTCCLRYDEIGQATLLNLILRNYLHFNQYESAKNLIDKSSFPEQASNNEYCRYLYYTGRIQAVQLEYQESLSNLNQAIRKAPDTTALGFRTEAQKLAIVVELLLGEIPDRGIFTQPEMKQALIPYYKLVQSILKGNLLDFQQVLAKYASSFIKDKLYTIIQRLHQIVIKTGLRKINSSYSKISFQDIAQKLNLAKNTNIEFIISKAIRDNVLQADIDHKNQWIVIKEKKELYTTNEPALAFQKRIEYCLNLYNQSTKALQYPNKNYKQENKEEVDEYDSDAMYSDLDLDF